MGEWRNGSTDINLFTAHGKWTASCLGRVTNGKLPVYPLGRKLCGTSAGLNSGEGNCNLEQAMKPKRGIRDVSLLFL